MSVRPVVPFESHRPSRRTPRCTVVGALSLGARDARHYPENCARCVPKVHSAIMHSVRGHAPTFFLLVFPAPVPRSFSPARIPRSPYIHPCDRCTTAVLSLCAVIFIFSFAENTQSDITDPETTRHSRRAESAKGAGAGSGGGGEVAR
jgi:hypothetical protein